MNCFQCKFEDCISENPSQEDLDVYIGVKSKKTPDPKRKARYEAHKEQARAYYQAHKDEIKDKYLENRETRIANQKRYYRENREDRLAYQNEYNRIHRGKVTES